MASRNPATQSEFVLDFRPALQIEGSMNPRRPASSADWDQDKDNKGVVLHGFYFFRGEKVL
jgi:hypothetical protein